MNGYVRRIIPQDGYALAQPYGFLADGYAYNIVRGAQILVPAIAIAVDNHPLYIVLQSTDPVNFPMSAVLVGDVIKLSG